MYMVTGTDYVFARNSRTGEILYKRWLWFDQNIGRTLWLGQQRAGSLVAVLKVLSRSAHGRPGREIIARESRHWFVMTSQMEPKNRSGSWPSDAQLS
jgi:hypothetical protein